MNYPQNEGKSGTISDVMPDIEEYARTCNGFVLEIGVQYGDGSTVAIQRGLADHHNPLHISVDHDDRMIWKPSTSWWHNLIGDDRLQETVDRVLAICDVRRPGVIFIDTNHDYGQMKAELNMWHQLAIPQTVWLFHDTWSCRGMTAAIQEFAPVHGWVYDDFRGDTGIYQCGLGRMRKV